jgi:ATP-dependent DNA ligase
MLQRTLPAGFIAPCFPSKTDKLPSGSEWLHEIKHDGFRVIARKKGAQVRLHSRPGNDLTWEWFSIQDGDSRTHGARSVTRIDSRACC